ncbi:MAG: cache domain-containing protein, partial [Treponema porcinum]|nr:cache domain-containing protein [Treponema porcinum]
MSARGSGGNFVYQEPLYDEATGFITLTLAKAVFSAGQLKGVVGADFTIDAFCDLANSMNISKNGIVHIINRQGILLTSTEREEILKRNYFDRNKIAGGSFDRKEYLDGTPKSIIKGDSYYAVAPLGDTPWFAVAQGPMSDFTGKIRLYS